MILLITFIWSEWFLSKYVYGGSTCWMNACWLENPDLPKYPDNKWLINPNLLQDNLHFGQEQPKLIRHWLYKEEKKNGWGKKKQTKKQKQKKKNEEYQRPDQDLFFF